MNCNVCRYSFMRINSLTGVRMVTFHRDHRVAIIGYSMPALHAAVIALERLADSMRDAADKVSRAYQLSADLKVKLTTLANDTKYSIEPRGDQPWRRRKNQRRPWS